MDVGSTMPNVKVEYASGSRVQEKYGITSHLFLHFGEQVRHI